MYNCVCTYIHMLHAVLKFVCEIVALLVTHNLRALTPFHIILMI